MNAIRPRRLQGIVNRTFALLFLVAVLFPGVSFGLPTKLGDLDEDGQPTVLDLVRLINHINGTNQLSSTLVPYGDLNEDGTINQADVDLVADAILGLSGLPNPFAPPVVSAPVSATNGSSLLITGVARPNRQILVTGGRFAMFTVADSNGLFSVTVDLRPNQLNNLFVTASSSNFLSGIPQPLRILQDSQPPSLYIDFPTNGQTLYTSNTVIAGRVGDMLSGFMGLDVLVHSSPSEGAPPLPGERVGVRANVNVGIGNNGTFERSFVPLTEGTNLITVTASDIHGNTVIKQITVQYSVLSNQPRLLLVSGDMQMTNVHRRLAQPIVVKAVQADGVTPFANKLVTFEVTRSDGRLLPVDPATAGNPSALTNDITLTPHGIMSLQLFTDANGEARAWWAMGGDAGRGNNRVCAMSVGISNAVYFCASARPAAIHQINIGSGNSQKSEVGGQIPEPLRAWVSDSCNGIPDIPVTFTITQGDGRLFPLGGTSSASPTNSLTILSSITGHASVLCQLGPDAGQNIIEANYPGNPGLPATFIAYGVTRDPSQPTRLSGLVLDNTSGPIGGAACSVSVGGQLFFTTTDAQGQFHFTNTPAGPAQLRVDGSTATNLLGALIPINSFPSLEFSLILIPNAENSLPSPVLLPKLNPNNARLYDGTTNLVLTCEGMEGLKMPIKAGSMRKPDGTLVTPDNPAYVSLNQVHHDSVPMPIPDGASPPFAWTLQPGGATFDPPIQIEYPNMSGLPAGTVAYFLSYNHDTRRFEIIASGHVQADSATIVTDPGAGLSIAGWGCNCPPYSVTGECQKECECPPVLTIPVLTDPDALDMEGGNTIKWTSSNPTIQANLSSLHARLNVFECIVEQLGYSVDVNSAFRPQSYQDHFFAIKQASMVVNQLRFENSACLVTCAGLIANVDFECNKHGICANPVAAVSNHGLGNAVDIKKNIPTFVVQEAALLAGLSVLVESKAFHLQPSGATGSCTDNTKSSPTQFHAASASLEPEYAGDGPELKLPLWTWTLSGQGVSTLIAGSFKVSNVSAPDAFGPGGPGTRPDFLSDDYMRVTGHSTADGTNRYAFSDYFQIRQGETVSISELTFTDIPPRKPESLSIVLSNRTTFVGQSLPLTVLARFADGSFTNVTPRTSWTSYRVSNPAIATVSPDGVVTGHLPGVVYVTAMNEGAVTTCGLNIVGGADGLTTLTGTVVDTNGVPLAGATVTLYDLAVDSVITGPDGRFSIANVPTTLGFLNLNVRLIIDGRAFIASLRLQGVSGGQTQAGVLVLRPLVAASSGSRFAAGVHYSVALREDGTLWTWGDNYYGQLGYGGEFRTNMPQLVLTNVTWKAVAARAGHTVALHTNGTLWTWGDNYSGQLGDGTFNSTNTPQPIQSNATWKAVAAGYSHTVALREDGTLWAWGDNSFGQLGDGTFAAANTPQPIQTNDIWQAVAAGHQHTVALRADGTLWTWGQNFYGQLADDTFAWATTPQPILTNVTWLAVAGGREHTVALRADGTLWTWGGNSQGQLGNGTDGFDTPTPEPILTNETWQAIAAGALYSMALRADGTLWTWGYNSQGQLGNGTTTSTNTPQPIQANETWQAIAAGESHTVGLRADGSLWAWGDIIGGTSATTPQPIQADATWQAVAVGTGRTVALRADGTLWAWGEMITPIYSGALTSTNSPQPILTNVTWKAVVAGVGGHTVALRADGTLWTWGNNSHGQLGNGTLASPNAPQPIQTNVAWQAIAVGDSHTLALREDGTLWAWGNNSEGQLGNGTFVNAGTPQPIQANVTWLAVAGGRDHTVALRADGILWTWGGNSSGQLGDGSTFSRINTPQPILTNATWRAVAAGNGYSLALRADGSLWTWGRNSQGQLGNGTFLSTNRPGPIQTNVTWRAIAAGDSHAVGLREDGTLWAWGYNSAGQLGNGMFTFGSSLTNTPQPISTNVTWQAISAGYSHTLALRIDGTLWSWGAGIAALGNDRSVGADTPQAIQSNVTWQAVSAGLRHTAGLREDGSLWAWGYNSYGQLGDGTGANADTPQPIQPNVSWQVVAAGYRHTAGLRADGTLWAWGDNEAGQLGNGTNGFGRREIAPQPVAGNATWQAVAAGDNHTVALRTDGTLWTWGDNSRGQLGNGTNGFFLRVNTPQPIQSNVTWRVIAAGENHSVALRTDGTLWTWGENNYGQLGNGTNGFSADANKPQAIQSNVTWQAVAAGQQHTVALRTDGTLWTWGDNIRGQLGTGTFGNEDTPQPIMTNMTWQAIAAGYSYTMALSTDGKLWAWGDDYYGQLGNGADFSSSTPQRVLADGTWQAVAAGGSHAAALRPDGRLWAWGDNQYGQIAQPVPWLPHPVLGGAVWGPPP